MLISDFLLRLQIYFLQKRKNSRFLILATTCHEISTYSSIRIHTDSLKYFNFDLEEKDVHM